MDILEYVKTNFNLDFVRFEEKYEILYVISLDSNLFVDMFLLRIEDGDGEILLVEVEDNDRYDVKFVWEGSREDFYKYGNSYEECRNSVVVVSEEIEMDFLNRFLLFSEELGIKNMKTNTAKKYNLR